MPGMSGSLLGQTLRNIRLRRLRRLLQGKPLRVNQLVVALLTAVVVVVVAVAVAVAAFDST